MTASATRGWVGELDDVRSIWRVSDADAEYSAFFRDQFASVTRAAYLILHDRDAAEDAAQEAFTQLHLRWSTISGYERPDAWVRRIAIRRAVRFAQRERLRAFLTRWVEPAREARQSVDADLAEAIRALPPQQRAAVVLHYFEDRPLPEVAGIIGCSHATAKAHVFKARKRLAVLLHDRSDEVADDV